MVEVLNERERRTSGALQDAAALRQAAEAAAADYEQQLQKIRLEIAAEMDAARSATQAAEQDGS